MDDDLNVSGALAVVHDTVRAGNTALDDGDDEVARDAALLVVAMTDVLGRQPARPAVGTRLAAARPTTRYGALDALVQAQLEARAAARAARDFATADAIRDQLDGGRYRRRGHRLGRALVARPALRGRRRDRRHRRHRRLKGDCHAR